MGRGTEVKTAVTGIKEEDGDGELDAGGKKGAVVERPLASPLSSHFGSSEEGSSGSGSFSSSADHDDRGGN